MLTTLSVKFNMLSKVSSELQMLTEVIDQTNYASAHSNEQDTLIHHDMVHVAMSRTPSLHHDMVHVAVSRTPSYTTTWFT